MKEQLTNSLPENVPSLPPGHFYRIKFDSFTDGILVVEIRRVRRLWSKCLASTWMSGQDADDAEEWVTLACVSTFDKWSRNKTKWRLAGEVGRYLGDHHY